MALALLALLLMALALLALCTHAHLCGGFIHKSYTTIKTKILCASLFTERALREFDGYPGTKVFDPKRHLPQSLRRAGSYLIAHDRNRDDLTAWNRFGQCHRALEQSRGYESFESNLRIVELELELDTY